MEQLPNGYTLSIPEGEFPLSTDSVLLAHFARLPRNARVMDLGSGCATLGLLLCSQREDCHITGVELSQAAHMGALENIRRNALEARLESICTDLRRIPQLYPAGSFHCCVSNPPYFSAGPASSRFPQARQERECTLAQLMQSAAWVLKFGGDLFLVHRPERLGEIIARAAEQGLEAKRLCHVRHTPGAPTNLILLQLRKGAKPGLLWQELVLHNPDGSPTEEYRSIYHL